MYLSSSHHVIKATIGAIVTASVNQVVKWHRLRWRSRLERSPRMRKVACSNPSRDRPMSLKQVHVLTAPLLKALQQVCVTGPRR